MKSLRYAFICISLVANTLTYAEKQCALPQLLVVGGNSAEIRKIKEFYIKHYSIRQADLGVVDMHFSQPSVLQRLNRKITAALIADEASFVAADVVMSLKAVLGKELARHRADAHKAFKRYRACKVATGVI